MKTISISFFVAVAIFILLLFYTNYERMTNNKLAMKTISELKHIKLSFETFYKIENRLPGDTSGKNIVGAYRVSHFNSVDKNEKGTADGCEFPYSNDFKNLDIHYKYCPFVDMYISGFHYFKPNPDDVSYNNVIKKHHSKNIPNVNVPEFESIKNLQYGGFSGDIFYTYNNYTVGDDTAWDSYADGYYVVLGCKDFGFSNKNYLDTSIGSIINCPSTKLIKLIDEKIDSGVYNSGDMRASCGDDEYDIDKNSNISYDESIKNNGKCYRFSYKVMELLPIRK